MENQAIRNLISRKELFWEVDPNRIETVLRDADDWVIVRIFEYGEIDDIFDVIQLYGEEKVRAVLRKEKLKPIASVMAYLFLGIDRYNRYGYAS
jgi:hypothetical protein